MSRRVLIPLDGSPLAERILAHLGDSLLGDDAELMLLHILRKVPAAECDATQDPCAQGKRAIEALQMRLMGQGVRARVAFMTGEPVAEILAFMEAYRPTLVAMSTHGRTGLSRVARGSVAEEVLRRSGFPILLASPLGLHPTAGVGSITVHRILVPTDGSDASLRAVEPAQEWARLHHAEIVLVHVVADSTNGANPAAKEGQAGGVLDRFARHFDPGDLRLHTRSASGIPEAEIVRIAREEGADLIVMATHGRTGFVRFLLGSVTEAVLRASPCPVLVVRSAGPLASPAPRRESVAKEA